MTQHVPHMLNRIKSQFHSINVNVSGFLDHIIPGACQQRHQTSNDGNLKDVSTGFNLEESFIQL